MLAREIAEVVETADVADDALSTARLTAAHGWPGVVVLDTGRPVAVLPTVELVRALVPGYLLEDPTLAGVLDEEGAARCARQLGERRVGDLLPTGRHRRELAAVAGDATTMECAATMTRLHAPLVLVTEDDRPLGVVTAAHLLEILLPD